MALSCAAQERGGAIADACAFDSCAECGELIGAGKRITARPISDHVGGDERVFCSEECTMQQLLKPYHELYP
jgi:hypothetical protein